MGKLAQSFDTDGATSVVNPENNEAEHSTAGFVKVRLSALQAVDAAAVNLYSRFNSKEAPVLYCRAGSPIDVQRLQEEAGVECLYVLSGDFSRFSSDLLNSLDTYLQQDEIPPGEKFAYLQLAVATEVEQTLRRTDCAAFCGLAERVGHDIVSLFAASDQLPRDLFSLARHDISTFTHVTNVAGYSVILAERLGVRDRQELEQIAAGAMLHDIGKRFIPANILTKPGNLDPQERALVESHPLRGYVELHSRPGLSFGQLMMVYQHHERVDGTGYPVGILADEIHPWAKLLAVVDVFDAMTAKRPYRRSASVQSVLAHQLHEAGTHFDREVVECWISAMNQA